ncbi:MAG: hypothetical protein LJE62_16975 [Silicimonas sp.]|nr:hypothetical protein [Silicimonas sp.]
MKVLVALLYLVPAVATAADAPISAAEFERLVTGKTFSYGANGVPYGAEAYYDNHRVQWTYLDGECHDGVWYQAGEQICFRYENIADPQCWLFFENSGRISAFYMGEGADTQLYETERQSEPLQCLGPKIGV